MIGGPQTFRLHIRSKYEPFLSFTYLALNPLLPPGSGKEPIVQQRLKSNLLSPTTHRGPFNSIYKDSLLLSNELDWPASRHLE